MTFPDQARILFIGESWLGSGARALKEAIYRKRSLVTDELNEDLHFPKPQGKLLRAIARFTASSYVREFEARVLRRVTQFKPDLVLTYKGFRLKANLLRTLRAMGISTANVYPDCSPHGHGEAHREAVGEYDLIVSTKPYHPARWADTYGYSNKCVFVAQGYDQNLHLCARPPGEQPFHVIMVGTYRREYLDLLRGFAAEPGVEDLKVAIGGNGWDPVRHMLPRNWNFIGELHGRIYVEWLRRASICVAPVSRRIVVDGKEQPGDEDSTRTYELAAAHCFFIHKRTSYIPTVYDESTEVPFFEEPSDLAQKVLHYLQLPDVRRKMSEAAHRRAVPSYSMDARAEEVLNAIREARLLP